MSTTLSPLSSLRDTIAERRKKAIRRREDLSLLRSAISTLLFIAIILTLFFVLFGFHIVDGNDMFPSLVDGDLALCYQSSDLKKMTLCSMRQTEKHTADVLWLKVATK